MRPPPPLDPPARVRILPDQKAGTVTVEIDGKRVLRIDRDGLWIDGDVNYSGILKDTAR